ncbi:hypothetical protein V501_08213 [Pseudogymnoascus sp. VKM F-4519 (FW-2642)]|nr:hypothetical protein V501_08213 [Pseudogymnoascus sp. VKM F-4519 (FW-2642)]
MPSGNIRLQTAWGDVYAGNIFINKNFGAWVVDLRGGWVEEFGHSEKAGRKEGSGKMSGKSLMNGFLET